MTDSNRIADPLRPLRRLLLVVASLGSAPMAAAAGPSVDQLAWLAGCWATERAEAGSGEQWMTPAGGALLGMSRTVRDGKTVAFEFMRIASSSADGTLAFFAQPSGKTPATFALSSLTDSVVVFDNPRPEFPQRIVYRLEAPGRLRASIEGMRDGVARSIDYPMLRVACAGPSDAAK